MEKENNVSSMQTALASGPDLANNKGLFFLLIQQMHLSKGQDNWYDVVREFLEILSCNQNLSPRKEE